MLSNLMGFKPTAKITSFTRQYMQCKIIFYRGA